MNYDDQLSEEDIGHFARLALCPKCKDTKFVKRQGTVPCWAPATTHYECTKCSIKWYGLKRTRREH